MFSLGRKIEGEAVRAHHARGLVDGSVLIGHTRQHTRDTMAFRDKVKAKGKITITKNEDEICKRCPIIQIPHFIQGVMASVMHHE